MISYFIKIILNILNLFHGNQYQNTDYVKASQELNKYSKFPINQSILCENTIDRKVDLMIIIPCYNCEEFIIDCLNSIFNQKTSYTYSVHIVDDGSTDNTVTIIKSYQDKYLNLFLTQQANKGAASARNKALEHIDGEYISFIDADDIILPNFIEIMINCAKKEDADLVECEFIRFTDINSIKNNTEYKINNLKKVNAIDCCQGYPWMKIYNSTLFSNFKFLENCLYEDTMISMILFYYVKNAVKISNILYGYRSNLNSITYQSRKSYRSIESFWLTNYLVEIQNKLGLANCASKRQYLDQSIMNYGRIRKLNRQIKKSSFVLIQSIYFSNFKNIDCKFDGKYKYLDAAICKSNYLSFIILSYVWAHLD